MNDLPRHTLSRIIAEHGRGICDAPKRIEALLRDLCGSHRREINIITGALEERVAADLIATGNSVPRDVLLARLEARLRDNLAYNFLNPLTRQRSAMHHGASSRKARA